VDGGILTLKSSAFGIGWIVQPGGRCSSVAVSFAAVLFDSDAMAHSFN
jgi:hypothetical protein